MNIIRFFIFSALIFSLNSFIQANESTNQTNGEVINPELFHVNAINDNGIDPYLDHLLSTNDKRYLLLEVSTTWCGSCKMTFPSLSKLSADSELSNVHFKIFLIDRVDPKDNDIHEYMNENFFAPFGLLLDFSNLTIAYGSYETTINDIYPFLNALSIKSVPTSILIDTKENNKIILKKTGGFESDSPEYEDVKNSILSSISK